MANPWAGEVAVVLDGRRHVAKLTLGALAELEGALGAETLVDLVARFEAGRFSTRDVLALLVAGLRGRLAGAGARSDDGGDRRRPGRGGAGSGGIAGAGLCRAGRGRLMAGIDWPGLMRAGLLGLGLEPAVFWRLTPAELRLMLGADAVVPPLTRGRLEELAAAFPDRRMADGGCRGDRGAAGGAGSPAGWGGAPDGGL